MVAEDELSFAVMECILLRCGRTFRVILPKIERGFGNIKRSINKYREASLVLPHVVLTDLDNAECAASLREEWGAENLPPTMMFRVAVRETEAWVLADRQAFATFAGIPPIKIPQAPDTVDDPKRTLINLVRRSRSRRLAAELVPPAGSSVQIGPMYNERLVAFVRQQWDPLTALSNSPSLERTFTRLQQFMR
ncbi:DUF4276 family protein [Variovorax sp. PBS-H4]|uniref:DUF4276 family protein n=1 Tax=Variovorax sp. PBS-H4 TaxID=434008 RepID=UPI0013A55EF8|nr:DUF4276 family protein [Variovorax sp. PBS-H4]